MLLRGPDPKKQNRKYGEDKDLSQSLKTVCRKASAVSLKSPKANHRAPLDLLSLIIIIAITVNMCIIIDITIISMISIIIVINVSISIIIIIIAIITTIRTMPPTNWVTGSESL